jgi:hypothetical protein
MTQPADVFSTYDAVGNREDLSDSIFDISPYETPFMSAIKTTKATMTKHEWQTDTLASPSATNAVIEGDDATTDASTATTRLYNYTQISDKVARVTGTQQAVNTAGREDEMDYQMMKRRRELKTDMESALLINNASVAGNDSTAREVAGVETWLTSNVSRGSGGSSGNGLGTTAATDGTQRAFTEAQLKSVLQSAWSNGGDPSKIYANAFNRSAISQFTGGATRMTDASEMKAYGRVEVYMSDFGELQVIPSRHVRTRSVLVLDPEYWAIAYLRSIQAVTLAKDGDSERKQIITEYTLECRNEKSSGGILDLTTS